MSDWMSFFIGLLIFLSAGILFCRVLFVYRSYKESVSDSDIQKTQEFLEATKVFVRDPNDFKDKDRDGIDDIIDTKID
jgi:hypothetical protein